MSAAAQKQTSTESQKGHKPNCSVFLAAADGAMNGEDSTHQLEVRQLEGLVVEGFGRAVEANGRQRPFPGGRYPICFQAVWRFRAHIDGRAAISVLLHLIEIV